uniref:RING-type E3 ubiquitin transferase n=1 Tax=Aegilops tauschii subsp. strangulata TaxID=200361 RepID=A0A453QPM2_AEGTS
YGYSCWFSCTVNCAIVISFVKLLGSKEEHEPLSSAFDGSSPASAIVAVDTNLDTSTPDTYRAPPAPLPYDVSLPVTENPVSCADLEKSDIKSKTDDQQESLKVDEYESCEKGAPKDKIEEEDVCPICLEENGRILVLLPHEH